MAVNNDGFEPRYPPLDLEVAVQRIREREAYTRSMRESDLKATVDADTEIMRQLLTEARNLREAIAILRELFGSAYSLAPSPETAVAATGDCSCATCMGIRQKIAASGAKMVRVWVASEVVGA